jgi:hypothetical protein
MRPGELADAGPHMDYFARYGFGDRCHLGFVTDKDHLGYRLINRRLEEVGRALPGR